MENFEKNLDLADDDFEFDDDELDVETLETFDALVDYLGSFEIDGACATINPQKVMEMKFACAAMKRALDASNSNARFVCKQSDLEPAMGYIDVEDVSLEIVNSKWFGMAAEFADNTEIYPLKEDKVRLTFTFYDLIRSVEKPQE